MYCKNCGSQMDPNAVVCTNCGVAKGQGSQFCANCGEPAATPDARVCVRCGAPLGSNTYTNYGQSEMSGDMVSPEQCRLGPGVAALLSVLPVGLGQMLNGQLAKGLLMLVGSMVVDVVIGMLTGLNIALIFWVISGVDAYLCAKKLRSGMPIGKFSFF